MEAEAARLEALLGAVQSNKLNSSSPMMGSRSSGSLARAGARAEIGEGTTASSEEPTTSSPAKRMEVIQLLSREVKGAGSGPGGKTRVSLSASSKVPMLLPTIAREEGNI